MDEATSERLIKNKGEWKMAKMKWWEHLAIWLVLIGGVNRGLVGAFGFNLVDWIFGVKSVVSTIIYIAVGVSALFSVYGIYKKK